MLNRNGKTLADEITDSIPAARSTIRRLVHNPADADDILQDTLLTALLKLHLLKPPFRLKAWLKTIARHKCLDHLKSRHRMPVWENIMKTDHRLIEELLRNDPDLHTDRAMTDRQIDQVVASIDRLKPILQDIIRLRYFSGQPVRRIAEVLGIPAGTVKRHLFKTQQQILQHLTNGIEPAPDLYPDIIIEPRLGQPEPIRRAGYGLCFGAPGKGPGDTEVCDMYEYPGPILCYRARSTVTRKTEMWGRQVFEVRNDYSRTTGLDTRLIYYSLDDDSIEMVMRIFCEQPETRVELPGDEMVAAEHRLLQADPGDAGASCRVALGIGDRRYDNVFRRSVTSVDDVHGSEFTESFWSDDGREVLQRLYIGDDWRMGGFVTFEMLKNSPELEVGGKRFRLWSEFVLVNHS